MLAACIDVLTCMLQSTFPLTRCWSVALKGDSLRSNLQVEGDRDRDGDGDGDGDGELVYGKLADSEEMGKDKRPYREMLNGMETQQCYRFRLHTMATPRAFPKQAWVSSFPTLQSICLSCFEFPWRSQSATWRLFWRAIGGRA